MIDINQLDAPASPRPEKSGSSHRSMSWFYEAPTGLASVFRLPPYLELYFQIFSDAFPSVSEECSRYAYLCWLLSEKPESIELARARDDDYVLGLLNKPYDNVEVFRGGSVLSNYHVHFFNKNQSSFATWGFEIGTIKGRQRFLVWCYTRGVENGDNFYLAHTLKDYLDLADRYKLDHFDVTRIFEMMLVSESEAEFGPESIEPLELELRVSRILFSYSQFRYPLTKNQISQLLGQYRGRFLLNQFWAIFRAVYIAHDIEVPVTEMDFHPTLTSRLRDFETDKLFKEPVVPSYLFSFSRTFHDQNLPDIAEEQEYGFLCWLFSEAPESAEVARARNDVHVLELLSKPYDDIEVFREGLVLSNYHFYYFQRNKSLFEALGLKIETVKGRQRFLVWCYTLGVESGECYYLTHTLERYLGLSARYRLDHFDVTRILEMILVSESEADYGPDSIEPAELEIRISKILFSYSQFKYPLTDNQISQLLEQYRGSLLLDEFWRVFRAAFFTHEDEVPKEERDIHPALKARFQSA